MGKRYRRHPICLKVVPFDIKVSTPMAERFSDHSSRRALCISVGGSLAFFMVQQPLRMVVPYHNPSRQAISCTKGELVSVEMIESSRNTDSLAVDSADNVSMGEANDFSVAVTSNSQDLNKKVTDDLMYVLSDGTVHGYALRSGVLMFQLSVRRIPIDLHKVGDSDHVYKSNTVLSSKSYKALKGSLVDLKQGDPCCIHYCKGTGHLAVGYSDGGVNLLTIHHADIEAYKNGKSLDITPSSNIPIMTSDTHHTPVTKMATISLTSKETKDVVEYLIIGDEYGLMSIWSIKHRHQLKTSAEVTRNYVGHCHKKGISHIEIIYLDHSMSHQSVPTREPVKNQCVILTTCLSGDIKAWSLSTELGIVSLVGSLNSYKKILALGITLLPHIDTSEDEKYFGDSVGPDGSRAESTGFGSHEKAPRTKDDDEFNIICATGHSDGTLSSWIFSSNINNARNDPTSVVHAHSSAVISIVTLPDVRIKENYFSQGVAKLMLSACCDGSACLFGIGKSGFLVPLHLYFSPGPTRAISVCQGELVKTPTAEVEIVQINETNMTSFIALTAPYNSSVIPVRWRQDTKPKLVDDLYVPVPMSHLMRRESSKSSATNDSLNYSPIEAIKSDSPAPKVSSKHIFYGGDNDFPGQRSRSGSQNSSPCSRASSHVSGYSVGCVSLESNRLSLQNLKETSARQQWKSGNDIVSRSTSAASTELMNDDLDPEKSKDNWTDTLGIRTELFLAKKDGELIELFRQRSTKDEVLVDVIRARDAAEILDQWISKSIDDDINRQGISKKQILEIFNFLGIAPRDMIDYIKVAKIASVLKTMHKGYGSKEPFDQPIAAKKNRLNKKFKAMKTVTTLVTYNSMGERVIQKIPLVDKTHNGIPDGYGDEIRQIWSLEPPRVLFHINQGRNVANDSEIMMKRVPLHIVGRLYGKIKIATAWNSNLEHWFDLRRTVRVARTIFDMRFVAQQDYLVKHSLQGANHYELPNMTDLVIKYFERSYGKGHGDMNVAHKKIVTFLEALYQYSEYSLVNSLRYFIFSEEEEFEHGTQPSLNYRTSNTYAWLYTESREWVTSNCMFLNGGEVQNDNQAAASSLHAGGVYLEAQSVTSLGGTASTLGVGQVKSVNVQWLLIRRTDALLCVHEMLRTRGCYGPAIIENLVYMVDSVLPPVSPVSAQEVDEDYEYSQPSRDYVDFEQFLEVLAFEMKKHDQEIARIRDKLFSTKSLPDSYLHATASLQGLMRHDQKESVMNDDVHEFVSLHVFQSAQDMMQLFIGLDPTRSGFIPTNLFRKALKKVLERPYDPDVVLNADSITVESTFRDEDNKDVLVQECVTRFGDTNGLDTVGYIDFIAVVLAYIFHCPEHLDTVNSEWMLSAIMYTRRSLDRDKGMVLLNYLSLAQSYRSQHDTYWMAHRRVKKNDGDHEVGLTTEIKNGIESLVKPGTAGDPYGLECKHPGKISYEGQWSLNLVAPAADGPGTLSIKKMVPGYMNGAPEVGLVCDGVVARSLLQKSTDSNLYIVPAVKSTSRTLSTLHGEVFVAKKDKIEVPKEKAFISQFDIGEEAFMNLPSSYDRSFVASTSSSRFPSTGSQIIEGYRFDNSTSLLRDYEKSSTASPQLTLTLPTETNAGSSEYQSPGKTESIPSTPPLPPTDNTPISTHYSVGNSRMQLPQEYIDLQNRSYILSEIDDLKINKKMRVEEENAKRRLKTQQSIEDRRSIRSSVPGSIISEGSSDFTLEEASVDDRSVESVTDIVNLFSKVSEVYPEGYVDQCVDESMKQLYALRDLEEEMTKELGDAALYQQLKFHEKYLKAKQERKEMRKKEKASMAIMEEQSEERFKRLEAGRNMLKKREEEAEAEKKAAEEAEKQKVIQRRIEREQAEQVKKEKALKEAEKYRELQELLVMRKVEKESIAADQYAKEVAEAARLKKIAEEEAKAAKEAAQRRVQLEKEKREAERVAREAERKRKEAENELRFAEMLQMQAEDWDVGKPILEPIPEPDSEDDEEVEGEIYDAKRKLVKEVNGEDDEDVGVDEDEEYYDTIPTKGKFNDAKRRLVDLIQNLKTARRGNGQHPRAGSKQGEFFQPMMFDNDIIFNPFLTHMQGDYNLMHIDDDEEDPECGFDDITRTIKEFKTKQHKDKMQRLYQFNNDNIPISEWTTLVLKETIDWEDFFDDDYEKAFPGSQRLALTPAEKKKRLLRKKEKAQQKKALVVTKQEDDVLVVLGNIDSLVDEGDSGDDKFLPEPKSVIPLPLGKVVRKDIGCGRDHFFQVELGDLSSILTIELNSTAPGENDCFEVDMSTQGYYPGKGKSDVKAAKYQSSNRHVIVFNPAERASEDEFVALAAQDIRRTTTLVIGVHHKESSNLKTAPYEIWAIATTGVPDPEALNNVSKSIKVLDMIASASDEDLWRNMPKVHRDAHKQVFAENSSTSPDRSLSPPRQSEERILMDSKVNDDEMEGFENFVTKTGRAKLRDNLSSLNASIDGSLADSQYTRLDRPVDPNMHEDLFLPPQLQVLDDVLDRSYSQSIMSSNVDGILSPSGHNTLPALDSPIDKFSNHSASLTHFDADDEALRQSEDDMIRKSESLPQLDKSAYGLGADSFFMNQSSIMRMQNQPVTHTKFPYISKTKIRNNELNPQPKQRKLREYPDPKPVKYTTRKF